MRTALGTTAAESFADGLLRRGYDLGTGVPCSYLKGLILALDRRPGCRYFPAVREDMALGLATGHALAGGRAVVLMQNSGLGYSLNVLTSLNLIFKVPLLLVVSWRGRGGLDAPEHLVMGASGARLLDAIGVAHRVIEASSPLESLEWAEAEMAGRRIPCVLWAPEGVFP